MKFSDTLVSTIFRYSIGIEEDSGQHYLSFPVSNGMVDYEEHYKIDVESYHQFLSDTASAVAFADECRDRKRDDLLILKPGRFRGIPS
ncbi:hypothetical protein JWS13_24865 [Rhodococcus pseudokoreensis]|uniref:Uncharacterized protein n=1 Tax=Rhodococcus pseudokoreensis TaxID=2811421 RepID=A0A974W5X4_9NOCA|nr:hypothetical protein [Rhodococcus pseudokoreensis]QSE91636.1 hypothetical protein JWS13_24865 [Rhodococcus pseudokoreensis]